MTLGVSWIFNPLGSQVSLTASLHSVDGVWTCTWTFDSCLLSAVVVALRIFSQRALRNRVLSAAAADPITSLMTSITKRDGGFHRIPTGHLPTHNCSLILSPVKIKCWWPLAIVVELHPPWALVGPIDESNTSWKEKEQTLYLQISFTFYL